MARQTAQARRDAPGFLDPRDLVGAPDSIAGDWSADKQSSSLMRGALDRTSDFSFVAAIVAAITEALRADGLPESLAAVIASEVLRSPSFAVEKTDGALVHIRHAVIFGRDDTRSLPYELIVRVDVWAKPRHMPAGERTSVPGAVLRSETDVTLVDLEADADVGTVVATFMGWLAEFPAPAATSRGQLHSVVFLGSPLALGCEGTPETWRHELGRLAAAFGLSADFHYGPDFDGSVGAKVRQVFRFDPYKGRIATRADGQEIPSVDVDVRAHPFATVFELVAVALANHEGSTDTSPFAKRALAPGEKVYHRKVGSNRRYDNFDKGSPSPCAHGEGSFIRFGGDKSRKGMAHRYSNFEVGWLRHCSKFPNCNVYAVFAPAASE